MPADPSRTPVICAVGEYNDRTIPAEAGQNSAGLMIAALQAADRDGGGRWMAQCDRLLVVPQISFRDLDVPGLLSEQSGLPAGRIAQASQASGDTPVRHLNDAANAIGAGEAEVIAVVGGEALRTAGARARAAGAPASPFAASAASLGMLRHRYGLAAPADLYALYENATRAAWGQTLDEAQAETGGIWSRMSEVAAGAEGAWLKQPRPAGEIVQPSPANRRIVFPYTKLMVANASVNQGAAFIVTSLARARSEGMPEDRLVYIRPGAAAHEAEDALARAAWTTPPSMKVALRRALETNGLTAADLQAVELYSCFPCVPKMARRVIGWPAERPVTVHGGLTFGGGPIGNYMSHAVGAMTRLLRGTAGHGLLHANGGYCTHNHAVVLSGACPARQEFPRSYDFHDEADGLRGAVPAVTDRYEGECAVETYTVMYDAQGAATHGVVLSRSPAGERVIALVEGDDAAALAFLTDGRSEPVGHRGVTARKDDRLVWRHCAD